MAMEKQEISPDSSVDSSSPQSKWLWLSLLIIALDQVTKHIAEANLPLHQAVSLFPFFDWYLTYINGGALKRDLAEGAKRGFGTFKPKGFGQ